MNIPNNAIFGLDKLLEYGLLGLSLAIFILSFLIFYKIVSQEKININQRKMATSFMIGAFAFFVISGIFYIYQKETPVEVALNIDSWNLETLKSYGNPKLKHKNIIDLVPNKIHRVKIHNNDNINIDFHEITDRIIDRESRIKILNLTLSMNVQDFYKLKGDVGVDDNGHL